MNTQSKLTFDELDIKCINELPIIVEVLSSTGNKIARVFEPLYADLLETINSKMPKGWQLEKKCKPNTFYPLIEYSYYSKYEITKLDNCFVIENFFQLSKKKGGKILNYFCISFGFYYAKDYENTPHIFFQINKEETKKYGVIKNLKFYNDVKSSIKQKFKNLKIEIEHPDKPGKDESFEIILEDFNVDKIESTYKSYRDNLVIPFLKSIK